ncbi:hypothetical protein BGZ67_006042 [Mortierella alpina]|nr:hypothetical protein BGZ67_006042 [Mortierella alpina]
MTLGRIEFCRVVSPMGIIIGSKSLRHDRTNGYDIVEWTPEHQRLLQAHLETDTILGILEGAGSQSQLLYHGHLNETGTVLVTGSSLWNVSRNPAHDAKVFQAIPAGYRGNIRCILTTNCFSEDLSTRWTDMGSHARVWAQTQSGELVFFKHGTLSWSRSFVTPVKEISSPRNAHPGFVCLYTPIRLPIFLTLKLEDFTPDLVVVADVRHAGLASILLLPQQPRNNTKCTIYPSSAQPLPPASIPMTDEENKKAMSSLNCTLGALEGQLDNARKKVQRLQSSLASKSEIIQNCQDLMSGPLCSVFVSGGGSLTNSSTAQEELQLFQRKRQQQQRRVLERLKPIVGSTVSEAFHEQAGLGSTLPLLDVEECNSGWIQSTNIFWVGAKVRNSSKRPVYNLRLSVVRQQLHGRSITQLEPQKSGWVLSVVDIDPSTLEDAEFLDRPLALIRLLSDAIFLHFDLTEEPVGEGAAHHVTHAIPKFFILKGVPEYCHSFLVI